MASDSVLLVLAHSRKHQPGVCVAGRAVRMESKLVATIFEDAPAPS